MSAGPARAPWLVAVLALLGSTISLDSRAAAQAPAAGRIVGNLDGVSRDGDHFFISGWACQQSQPKSIAVHVYGADPHDLSRRTLLIVQFANLYSGPEVAQRCRDGQGGKHRFVILLPHGYGPQSRLFVHGIRVVEGVANEAIAGSGQPLVRLPGLETPYPALPRLAGAYRPAASHPRVFLTAADLTDLAQRINFPGSYSGQRFELLVGRIKSDLASGIDWSITYAGCEGGTYQYLFSYEPQDQHEADIHAQLQLAPAVKAPAGAAVVASRLALYAALIKAGASPPPGAPGVAEASNLAKRILLAWAARGFPRDSRGRIVPLASRSCGPTAKPPTMTQPRDTGALSLGRGVLYSAHAQDLLEFLGALNPAERDQLDLFHRGMFELLRQSVNVFFGSMVYPYPDAARYGNPAANAVASLLATARLADDAARVDAVLYGSDRSAPLLIPWTELFDRLIYGESDTLPDFGQNRYPDSLTSLRNHADFQTADVAPGEIADRGRNMNPLQGIGYPMFSLERLIDSAEILQGAGFDAYGYRGRHQQSIEMAMRYYACFAHGAGFYQVVTAENSGSCPNAAQYYGKLVNGVDRVIPIGTYRFPSDSAIAGLDAAAKTASSTGIFSTDAILFGKWTH